VLQKRSRAGHLAKKNRWNYRQILLDLAGSLKKQGIDGLVSGHFHLALRENLPGSDFKILALGDWMEQFTYGEMQNGELYLKSYSPPTS
jgi:UDP-2,3-diacylglucosamine pyrophosphatase LpxH